MKLKACAIIQGLLTFKCHDESTGNVFKIVQAC